MVMCLFGLFLPGGCSPVFATKQANKNHTTDCQHGEFHPDCSKIDSCKQLAKLCNKQCLVSLVIVEETVQDITMHLSVLEELEILGGILVSQIPVEIGY